jgi:hypothetical protein
MIAATVVGVLLLMLSAWPLSMSPMIFDSGESLTTWGVFIALWLLPLALIAGLVTGWIGFARNVPTVVFCGLVLAVVPVAIAAGILAVA